MNTHNTPDRRGTGSIKWDLARTGEIPLWVADMDFPIAPDLLQEGLQRVRSALAEFDRVPQ